MRFRRLKEKYFGIDGILILVGVAAMISSSYYFFQDDGLGRVNANQLTSIGRFSVIRNDVRRRTQNGLVWSSVIRNDLLFEGDTIFTADKAEVSVQLGSGGQIDIEPNTIIVFKPGTFGVKIDLRKGAAICRIDENTNLEVEQTPQSGQAISSQKAELRLERSEPDQDLGIRVVKGEVKTYAIKLDANSDGAETRHEKPVGKPAQLVKENEIAKISKQSADKTEVLKEAIELISPADAESRWLSIGQGLQFKWQAPTNLRHAKFQLSTDPEFKTLLFSSEVKGTTYSLSPEARPNGQIYWRVLPPGIATSRSSRLTIYPDTPPLLTFPADAQEFAYVSSDKGKQVLLSWEDSGGSTEYEVQVAVDEAFQKLYLVKKITATNHITPALPNGSYYWRVKGLHAQRANPPWSRTLSFRVFEGADQVAAPVLLANHINYEIPASVLAHAPEKATIEGPGVTPDGIAAFTWGPIANAESYEVEIATNPEFVNSIKFPTKKELKFAPLDVKPGAFFVRVRAKMPKGQISPPSLTGRLDVTLPAPDVKTIEEAVVEFANEEQLIRGKHEFKIEWDALKYANSYEINWGADQEFAKSKKFRLKDTKRIITVTKPGLYAVRVRAIGVDGEATSRYSEIKPALFLKELASSHLASHPNKEKRTIAKVDNHRNPNSIPSTLQVPALIEPRRATSFVSLDDAAPVVQLKWLAVRGAKGYEIEVAEDADFTKPVTQAKSKQNSFTLKAQLPEGRVFWRVRAVGSSAASSPWSDVFDINVLYQ